MLCVESTRPNNYIMIIRVFFFIVITICIDCCRFQVYSRIGKKSQSYIHDL